MTSSNSSSSVECRVGMRPVVAECRPECFGELGHQEQLAGRQEAIAGCGWCDHGAQVEVGKVTDVDASALLLDELEAFTGTFVFTGSDPDGAC